MIQGSECSSFVANYNGVSYFSLEGYLHIPENYVVAACEKRGITTGYYGKGYYGCGSLSKEYLAHESLTEQASDYFLLVNYLKSRPKYLNSKVILDGSSDGVIVATKLLKLMHYNADAVILTSGQYVSVKELIKSNKCRGMNRNDIKMVEEKNNTKEFNETWHGHTYRYWDDKLDYRPIDDLIPYEKPIYIFHGQLDHPELAQKIIDKFNGLNKTNLRSTIYPGATHRLFDVKNKKSYSEDRYRKIFEWLDSDL